MTSRFQFYYAGAILVLALVLGGGTMQGLWTDRLIEIALIPAMIGGLGRIDESRWGVGAKLLVGTTLLLCALQFLPVGRSWPNTENALASGPFLTSAAGRTVESLLFFIPLVGFALFLSRFSDLDHERLLRFVIVGLLINLGVGTLQLSASTGGAAGILPYRLTVGVFANPNHFSTLVLLAIPILAYFFLYRTKRPVVFLGLLGLMLIYLFAVGSRAGMGLSLCVTAIAVALFAPRTLLRPFQAILILGVVALTGGMLALQPDLFSLEGTSRGSILSTTLRALADHWIVGTGIGSFENVYAIYENVTEITNHYVNHAHNEYFEIALETGIAGPIMIAAFFLLVIRGARRTKMTMAFTLSIGAIAAHSLVDYPLRTMAIATLLAYFTATTLSTTQTLAFRPASS